jgi:hypothetical protein
MKIFNRNKPEYRELPDEQRFVDIFCHLEQHPDEPKYARVGRILELFRRLGVLLKKYKGKTPPRGPKWSDIEKTEAVELMAELRELLKKYRWRSQVSLSSEGFCAFLVAADAEGDKWEYEAIGDLLALIAVEGGLSRLRRCFYDGCKRWFYAANRSDQKFCKDGVCRQNHYYSDPESQKKHRAAVRDYDARQKERDESSRRRVGFKGPVARRAKSQDKLNGRAK